MPIALVQTKLFRPPARADWVERPRLLDQLERGRSAGHRLILVSAPPGYGKTSLLGKWLESGTIPSAWLALDEADNDPARFWSHVILALQALDDELGQFELAALRTPQPPPIHALLPALLNDIAALPQRAVLVLDDYHVISTLEIHDALAFVLDHLPPNLQLIISTRTDPPLPLSRLRARNQLTEVRAADLRFTFEEAAAFLNAVPSLTAEQMTVLAERTEGWIAGLHLAALSLQGRDQESTTQFISTFSGRQRLILDYLTDEVLKRQTDPVQDFMLRTSILDRMCGPLCDAIMNADRRPPTADRRPGETADELWTVDGGESSSFLLAQLERDNLFVVPLDDERYWYRYHHLFADLLRKRLRQVYPDSEAELHCRASQWYEQNHLPYPAVEHAFQARDFPRAARLLEESAEELLNRGEYQQLLHWLHELPEEQLHTHSRLYVVQALILAAIGKLQAAEQCLRDLDAYAPTGVDTQDLLADKVVLVRALIAVLQGDVAGSSQYTQRALAQLARDGDSPWHAHLLIALSHLNLAQGNLEAARQNLVDAIAAGKLAGHAYLTLDATAHLVLTLGMQGRLKEAGEISRQGLEYIEQRGLRCSLEAGMLYLAQGFTLCEQQHLDQAEQFIRRGLEISRTVSDPPTLVWAWQILIHLLLAKGDLREAEEVIQEADMLVRSAGIPLWIECGYAGLKTQVWTRLGKLDLAEQHLRQRGITPDGEIQYPYHGEYDALAGLLCAKGEWNSAVELLNRLERRSEASGQQSSLISTWVQLTRVYQAQGKRQAALETLAKAIERAEPGGYVRIFMDESKSLAGLVRQGAQYKPGWTYAQTLLAAMSGITPKPVKTEPVVARGELDIPVESLTARELEILQLLAEGLSNRAIAQKLYLSPNTLRSYTYSIYSKLGVHSRMQAVVQGRACGLIPRD